MLTYLDIVFSVISLKCSNSDKFLLGKLIRNRFWSLLAGYYRFDQFIVEFLEYGKPLEPGVWTVLISAFDLLLEKNIHKEEDILVKYKFVVLPFHEPKKIIDNHHINTIDKHNNLLSVLKSADFYKFWSLDSACIQNANVFKRNSVVISCKNAYWSTFYTDPKSDLISKVSIDLNDRL